MCENKTWDGTETKDDGLLLGEAREGFFRMRK